MTDGESQVRNGQVASDRNDSVCSDRLRGMIAGGRVPLDELAEDIEGVRALIKSGEARLEVVLLPWGLSFNLVAAPLKSPAPLVS